MSGRDKEKETEERRRVFPIQTDTPDDTEKKKRVGEKKRQDLSPSLLSPRHSLSAGSSGESR